MRLDQPLKVGSDPSTSKGYLRALYLRITLEVYILTNFHATKILGVFSESRVRATSIRGLGVQDFARQPPY